MTQRCAIIIALGQPSDAIPHDATMRAMAEAVARLMPDWTLRGATLESPRGLAEAARGLTFPLVYPLFLANGFFMANVLPKRLAQLVPGATILPPFGDDPAIPGLVAGTLRQAAQKAGYAEGETSVLLAAHGSEMFPASRLSTQKLAAEVAGRSGFKQILPVFIEEHPLIEEAASGLGQAICLPLFALNASHAAVDVPASLARAGFAGVLLPPIGMHSGVPALIAAALRRHMRQEAA